ncbi:hypothetical protein PVAND_003838 [Polypedilum vanderplanki]|uniref:Uncharacterized protein n=1 Tax=Polypedilum vanderplanki TaxID=319348 RepID=A0A9J6BVT1_POLVA|nr:hypothetical protein PVAND_003838 [Polypedilum vanderplanki]
MWQNPQQQPYNQQNYYPPPPTDPYQQQQPYPPYNPAYPHQTNPFDPYIPPQTNMNHPYQDPEDADKNFEFNDESIRRGFIRKVYSILSVQLMVSLGFIAVFVFHDGTKLWVHQHPEMVWISLGVLLVTMIALACCENVRRSFPMNFIFLGIFTLAQSFVLGCTSARYAPQEIFIAVGVTAAVCFGLTIFAFQTKWDFTMLSGILFVAVIVLMLFGIIAMFFPGKTITLVYASCGALLFCIYLIYDTQLMMGGKHKYSISPEEYIFAALNLYLDIVNIFIYILTIIGASRD